ncbi:MAG: hypothetical protein Q7S21_04505 [archaeon]|nr:hypothetical protein [archaeon]
MSELSEKLQERPRKLVLEKRLAELNEDIVVRYNFMKALDSAREKAKFLRAKNDLKHLFKLRNEVFDKLINLNNGVSA